MTLFFLFFTHLNYEMLNLNVYHYLCQLANTSSDGLCSFETKLESPSCSILLSKVEEKIRIKDHHFVLNITWAILSKSWPSGLESIWKLAWRICICSSVKVVRIRFVFFFEWDSVSPFSSGKFKFTFNIGLNIWKKVLWSG